MHIVDEAAIPSSNLTDGTALTGTRVGPRCGGGLSFHVPSVGGLQYRAGVDLTEDQSPTAKNVAPEQVS